MSDENKMLKETYLTINKVTGGYLVNAVDGSRIFYDLEAVIDFTKKIFTAED